jgi:NAD(P)-dependent dehydrogenase (short-subunit alcohol dehydrogenase family)
MPSNKVYLVTNSNVGLGLGLDASRQLALQKDTKKVYLACRTESKAATAIDGLVKAFGIPQSKLVFVPFDASASKTAILKEILHSLPQDEKLDGLIFNAGGLGHNKKGVPSGPNHVMDMMQINLLSHIHLLDTLKANGRLNSGAAIVYSGSEAACGVALMGMAAPKMPKSAEDYTKLIEGSGLKKYDPMEYYSIVKAIAALYFAAWARENPEYFVLTVSLGATGGTNITSHKGMPKLLGVMMPYMMQFFGVLGQSHMLEVGAKRYVDAVAYEGGFKQFESGTFVASKKGTSGRVADQSTLCSGAKFREIAKQDAAYQAVCAFA